MVPKIGGDVSTLYTGTNVAMRVLDGGLLYFTEGSDLKAISVTGGNATSILSGLSVSSMGATVQDANNLYWPDWSAGLNAGTIERFPKAPGVVQTSQIPPRPQQPRINFAELVAAHDAICKRSLVVIVHGWNSNSDAWARPLAAQLQQEIASRKSSCETWYVQLYDWKERAALWNFPLPPRLPSEAFANAYAEGSNLGNELKLMNLDHIHFIAHSAGSNLIQTALETIFASSQKKPATVQMTFLDAYYPESEDGWPDVLCYELSENSVGPPWCYAQTRYNLLSGVSPYGLGATWAEQYVDRRDTKDATLVNTNRLLPNAFNFDITQIDSNLIIPLTEAHAWPYIWYACNIDLLTEFDLDKDPIDRRGCLSFDRTADMYNSVYGPAMSREYKRTPYAGMSGGVCYLTSGQETCAASASTLVAKQVLTPSAAQFALNSGAATSQTGTINLSSSGSIVQLWTGSPVWVNFQSTTGEPFNAIQFEYQFLTKAKGLLSVFIDGKQVFLGEEMDAEQGIHISPIIPVGPLTPGMHSLSIRLDPQSADQSGVEIRRFVRGLATIQQVQNQPPLSLASGPSLARQGSVIALNGAGSYDPDKFPRPLGYIWKQLSGPTATLSDWYSATPTFVASQQGQYTFTLTVTDGPTFVTSSEVNIKAPILGDIDGDSDVDNSDLAKITSALNTKASGLNDLRDLNGDGMITALDARKLVTLCTRPRCATQ